MAYIERAGNAAGRMVQCQRQELHGERGYLQRLVVPTGHRSVFRNLQALMGRES